MTIRVEIWKSGPPSGEFTKEPWFAVRFSGRHKINLHTVLRDISQADPEKFLVYHGLDPMHPLRNYYLGLLDEDVFMYGEERIFETIAAWPVVKDKHMIDFEHFGELIAAWTRTTSEPLQGPNEFRGWKELTDERMRARLLGNKETEG